jgi:putative hemolysin
VQPVFPFTARDLLPPRAQALAPIIDRIAGLHSLQRLYERRVPHDDFPASALRTLDIAVDVADHDLAHIPRCGSLVIAANHPHGAADGLALAHVLGAVRRDVKVLATEWLARIPEMRERLIAVDVFNQGRGRNRAAITAAVEWLRDGHALVVFPAGEVSHMRTADGRIVDGAWHDGVARLAAGSGAPVLPVFIEGRNSGLFVAAGRVHPLLRTALLPRELLHQRGRTISVRIGRAVTASRLDALGDASVQTAYLRLRSYGLAAQKAKRVAALRFFGPRRGQVPLANPIDPDKLRHELEALPADALLIDSGPWAVFCADAASLPNVLQEIGRLRELTFRDVGEGTDCARDLDRFDRHYRHLFVWHRERQVIAGAYRIGATDRIVGPYGLSGLYTRTLFRYPRRLLREMGPALELGRSFVQPEFQRDYQPLLLLWRGIGRLVANEPRYRRLFGPVSISAEYGAVTRHLLARFLLANRFSAELGSLVRPKRPLAASAHDTPEAFMRSTVASQLEDVDEIVRELEAGRRGMPVLLRQYLKLNAKLLGFSVDPAFGHVLDGLVVVDLLDVERPLLARYLGKDGAARFLAWHAAPASWGQTPAAVGLKVRSSYAR